LGTRSHQLLEMRAPAPAKGRQTAESVHSRLNSFRSDRKISLSRIVTTHGRSLVPPVVGIVANPVSARDIRRVIANASSLQVSDRANIVLRVLASLKATGIETVLMMPERGGIRSHIERSLARAAMAEGSLFPHVRYLDLPIMGDVRDTHRSTAAMVKAGVAVIVVLGGDGTHRAVASYCGKVPIAGISTGTNNAFPEHREPTITGLAVGLAAMGRLPRQMTLFPNKRLVVILRDRDRSERREIALVDVAIVTGHYVGARALWRRETFRELYVTFAEPEVIGMSSIPALLEPISRSDPDGLIAELVDAEAAPQVILAPIAPGLIQAIGVRRWERLKAGRRYVPATRAGAIALDGEREVTFDESQSVEVEIERNALFTIDVGAVMRHAASQGLMRERLSAVDGICLAPR
jgi:predicted polyphosphate/ATP-dependent NAD kinase